MSRLPEYERGYTDAMRQATTWLHDLAREMNDPHAIGLFNCAAFWLGGDESRNRKARRANISSAMIADLVVSHGQGAENA